MGIGRCSVRLSCAVRFVPFHLILRRGTTGRKPRGCLSFGFSCASPMC
jgi:hypothetical protein